MSCVDLENEVKPNLFFSLTTVGRMYDIVLQQSLNKSLSFRDGPTGGTSFVNIYQNVRLDP